MVIKCSVPGCRNESFPGCGISFHSFPENEILKQQWRNAVPLRDVQYHHKVCSKHFKKTDFITRGASVRLNQNAVPYSYSAFTASINRGALCFTSRPVYQILKQAEKTFRQTDFDSLNYNIRRRLVLNIIQHFANDISTLLPHPLTQGITCEDLHKTQLLMAISEAFVNIRCKYYFRLKEIKLSDSKTETRQKLHNQILFNNL